MSDPHLDAGGAVPPIIHATAVFTLESARELLGQALGIAPTCLGREIRLGRLRASKKGGKYLILGSWLLEWVEGGEVTRRKRHAALGRNCEQPHD